MSFVNPEYNQGDVYLLKTTFGEGEKEKPVVIVSNDEFNRDEEEIYVVPITFEPKKMDKTMFFTKATGTESVAICCNIKKVEKNRLTQYIGELTCQELISMKDCFATLFSINDILPADSTKTNLNVNTCDGVSLVDERLEEMQKNMDFITKERDFFKQQYDILISKIIDRK